MINIKNSYKVKAMINYILKSNFHIVYCEVWQLTARWSSSIQQVFEQFDIWIWKRK